MGLFTSMAVGAGSYAGYAALNYTANTTANHLALWEIANTQKNVANLGGFIAGRPGQFVGNGLGMCAAGLGINQAVKTANNVSGAIKEIGGVGIELAKQRIHPAKKTFTTVPAPKEDGKISEPQKLVGVEEQGIDWGTTYKVGKAALIIGATVGATALGAGVFAPMALSALRAVPDVAEAVMEKARDPKSIDFIGHVAAPAVTDLAIGAAGTLAAGYVAHQVVQNAYNGRVTTFTKLGKAVDSIMPDCVKGAAKTVGRWVGHVDAGRVALSPGTVNKAVQAGETTKQVVETGLGIAAMAATNPNEGSGWLKTAAVIGTGVVAAAAFTAVAPQAAAFAIGSIALNAAAPTARYIKAKYMGESESAGEQAGEDAVKIDTVEETPKQEPLSDAKQDDVPEDVKKMAMKTAETSVIKALLETTAIENMQAAPAA